MDQAASNDEAPTDLLQQFLAGHDAACPGCRYNLRGAEGGKCPECGGALTLAVGEKSPLLRGRGLLVLLFAWLLIAGGFNAARAGRQIYNTVSSPMQVWLTTAPNAPPRPIVLGGRGTGSAPLVTTINPLTPGANQTTTTTTGPVTWSTGPSGTTLRTSSLNMTFNGNLARTPGTGSQWSYVSWTQWTSVGMWTLLALMAVAGLLIILRYRRRPATARVARTLMTMAWLGFGGYFAYHVFVFANEWV